MADKYTNEAPAKVRPVVKQDGRSVGARPIRRVQSFTIANDAIGDRLLLPTVPKGARGLHHRIQASAGLGGVATLALGITGNIGKYRAAATLNVTVAEDVSSAANMVAVLAADEDQFLTVAAAALPAGPITLVVITSYNI